MDELVFITKGEGRVVNWDYVEMTEWQGKGDEMHYLELCVQHFLILEFTLVVGRFL